MNDRQVQIDAPRRRMRHIGGALLAGVAVLGTGLWIVRRPIADTAVRGVFDRRGIPASYRIAAIGARWHRIEALRIGDPRAPDLTADWVELRLGAGLSGISVSAVRAGGVRVKGRLVDGRLRFGMLDRLLPSAAAGGRFVLPDLDVDLTDVRMRLDTPSGPIGARIDGRGNIANGLTARIAVVAPVFDVARCRATRATAFVGIHVVDRIPRLDGPVRLQRLSCRGADLENAVMMVNVSGDPELRRWRGKADLQAATARQGDAAVSRVSGRAAFEGTPGEMRGALDLAGAGGAYRDVRAAGMSFNGRFAMGPAPRVDGRFRVEGMRMGRALTDRLSGLAGMGAGTPVGPIAASLAGSAARAANDVRIDGVMTFAGGRFLLKGLAANARSGAVLRMSGGSGLEFGEGGVRTDAAVQLSGGGFPVVDADVRRRPDGLMTGMLRIAPISAGGARLAVQPVRFAMTPRGVMRIETAATIDGPVGGGRLSGLSLPLFIDIAPTGGIVVNRDCATLRVGALTAGAFALGRSVLRLCPVGGGMLRYGEGGMRGGLAIAAPAVVARLGDSRLALAADRVIVALDTRRLDARKLVARLGQGDQISRIEIGALAGTLAGGTIRGSFDRLSGKLAAVPLRVDGAAGTWLVDRGVVQAAGSLRVTDDAPQPRFNPLVSRDVALRVAGGRIVATASLMEPGGDTMITRAAIVHDLAAGKGWAQLDVPQLRFGKSLQPEALTRLTIGVVANVEGVVSGRGDIRWSPTGVTSTGRFTTRGLDFAAAFGPVRGLTGDIVFSDLLALVTPAGQVVRIASVNPGTLVTDGAIRYRLLPGQRIAVEHGDWPFAGGTLTLQPTVLDMGQPSDRRLTFRVDALDAARFIQTLEFENLSATGIFDGVLPMIFNDSGGRIEGGSLVARKGGGTVAYVGDVSNARMNVFGKLAFDALKSMRYQNLAIDLNGPLDGEIVSRVNFSGRNEAPLSAAGNVITRQLVGLPFKFNVTIRAPFRSLLNTARTLQDPTSLIERTVVDTRPNPVQTNESDPKR